MAAAAMSNYSDQLDDDFDDRRGGDGLDGRPTEPRRGLPSPVPPPPRARPARRAAQRAERARQAAAAQSSTGMQPMGQQPLGSVPVAQAYAQPQPMAVTCPPGLKPGDSLVVTMGGQQVTVQVPEGITPGGMFMVQPPPQQVVAVAVATPMAT